MPYRIYQGKEVRTSDLLVLPRGEISVDIDTLEVMLGDGATPGGVPLTAASTGTTTTSNVDGGSAATVYTIDETFNGGGA